MLLNPEYLQYTLEVKCESPNTIQREMFESDLREALSKVIEVWGRILDIETAIVRVEQENLVFWHLEVDHES